MEIEAPKPAKASGRALEAAIASLAGVGAAAALYVMGLAACKPMAATPAPLSAFAHGGLAKLQDPQEPAQAPDAGFIDAAGKPVKLSDFKGQVLVVNLWATWCAPCVKEMPTLAQLQAAFAGKPVKVVALSTDGPAQTQKAKAFMSAYRQLDFYQDEHLAVTSAITPHVQGFPTTLLYDRSGRLRGLVQGEADWSSPEARGAVASLAGS